MSVNMFFYKVIISIYKWPLVQFYCLLKDIFLDLSFHISLYASIIGSFYYSSTFTFSIAFSTTYKYFLSCLVYFIVVYLNLSTFKYWSYHLSLHFILLWYRLGSSTLQLVCFGAILVVVSGESSSYEDTVFISHLHYFRFRYLELDGDMSK